MSDEKNTINDPLSTIASAARTQHVEELNGNSQMHKGKTRRQFLNGTARDENGNEVEVNAQAPVSPYSYKYLCRMDDKPVNWDQVLNLDPMLRATKGWYMIKYTPIHSKDYRRGRPFKIGQDLIRWDVRVSGIKEWNQLCDRIPEFGWLRRNSTINEYMFGLAKRHPGMSFFCTVKWQEYEEKLQSQSDTVLRDPYVSRKVSAAEYRDKYKAKDKAVLVRYFNDILKEINEVEALQAVQEEMLAEAGTTYDRSRKVPRDPITGQFIKKSNTNKEE